jgi:nucleoside-diphosphate-sugar epimerase
MIKSGKMRVLGDGRNYIPLIYIDDLIQAFDLVLDSKKAENEIYNVDGGYDKTQRGFYEAAAEVLGVEPPTKSANATIMKLLLKLMGKSKLSGYIDKLARNRRISIEKIKKLGYEPKVNLREGMRQTLDAFEKGC